MKVAFERYLDLLELSLIGALNEDPPFDPWHGKKTATDSGTVVEPGKFDVGARVQGLDWPLTAPTMIGQKRMRQLREAVETVLDARIEGDFIECGAWRGGACIYMQGVLNAYSWGSRVWGTPNRKIFVADSFEGLPKGSLAPDENDAHHGFPPLAVSLDEVVKNFVRYDLLADNVVFVKGWFKDTLPTLPTERLAILRLDGDMYESTRDALQLYAKLSPGGFCIVDDYESVKGCKQAVDEFRREVKEAPSQLVPIDGTGVYWRKP